MNHRRWRSGQCLCWRQLVALCAGRSGRNYKWNFPAVAVWRPVFQLTDGLLDGKWKPVRGHRANRIDNKQELQRAVWLSSYRRSLVRYG
ncbi:hypothetical protein P5V15_006061 [Pogonomyrmex californicus]